VNARSRVATFIGRLPPGARRAIRLLLRPVPKPLKERAGRALDPAVPPSRARWGNLRRQTPFDPNWGYGRGTPIDRVYIETFLHTHAADIGGRCLEILNSSYTTAFGGVRVDRSDVLDIDPSNVHATVVADLGRAHSLPRERYDCFVMTQTLHLIPDMPAAVDNAWNALAPGGVLLVTAPALGRHDWRAGEGADRWRVTPAGLSWLMERCQGHADIDVFGNLVACTAWLHGLAAEELSPEELDHRDRAYPLIVGARVQKPVS
jgi:SAM-dependent methyltransferase